jgi:hypothetical protein
MSDSGGIGVICNSRPKALIAQKRRATQQQEIGCTQPLNIVEIEVLIARVVFVAVVKQRLDALSLPS